MTKPTIEYRILTQTGFDMPDDIRAVVQEPSLRSPHGAQRLLWVYRDATTRRASRSTCGCGMSSISWRSLGVGGDLACLSMTGGREPPVGRRFFCMA